MKKLTMFLFTILVILFFMVSCSKNNEIKIIMFNENHKNIIEDLSLLKNFNLAIIDNGSYWTVKNISEEALLEYLGLAHLKMNVIANNIANVYTEDYTRKYVKITVENGIEVVSDTENVDLTRETVDMIEIQRFYEAIIENLNKINKNIILM
ncbi:MAG: hypothetical protein FWD13_12335 [Treponema sp.]|nr:hypothetical protein [Treponema sp.]